MTGNIFSTVIHMGELGPPLILTGILTVLAALTTVDRRITIYEAVVLFIVYFMLVFSLEHPALMTPTAILLTILALIIAIMAIKDRRFYWLDDFIYTLREAKGEISQTAGIITDQQSLPSSSQ